MRPYEDKSLAPAERAMALMSEMTIEEKVAQLSGIWAYEVLTDFNFDPAKARDRMGNGIGQITRAGGSTNLRPANVAKLVNRVQRYLKENTRLGIPALVHDESCAGLLCRDADVFPQALGVAAGFDPDMPRRMGELIREQMLAIGSRQALAPLMDVTRDPRWGRCEESYGEDPFLVAQMGINYIKGLQGESLQDGVVATGKHFVGYGASEGAFNWAPAHIPPRELEETYLYPFEAAVREGGLKSVMPSYNELDGVPCHTNSRLIEDILRKKWGFDGIIVSDYFAIDMIHSCHKAASTVESAARMALEAGVDVELPSTDCYGKPLVKAVREGLVPIEQIDRSVLRVLEMKFALGLFENPYVDEDDVLNHYRTDVQRDFALESARKSMTLLKNEGILPIKGNPGRVAVIGPNADSVRNMLGDYSYPAHVESLMDQLSDNFADTPNPDQVYDVNEVMPVMDSVLEGLRKLRPDVEFAYAKGCSVLDGTDGEIDEAVALGKDSDMIIAVMGDKAGLIEDCSSGETRDRATLTLPARQSELVLKLCETGVPVVLVIVGGRPFSLVRENEKANAILEAWLPGEEGARAIAETLFGVNNPAGRLPITFPRSVGQVPVYYAHRPSGGESHWRVTYVDESNLPLYPFGHGLSYTKFEYSDLKLPRSVPLGEKLTVEATITNAGDIAGDEVVQLYMRDDCANDITRPVMELKGFRRVNLAAGESKVVRFTLDTAILAFLNRAGEFVLEPGTHSVMLGASSADIRLTGQVELTGEVARVSRRVFATESKVL